MANGNPPAAKKRTIDLDKLRAARAETHGDPIEVVFGGETFALPAELPFQFAEGLTDGDLRSAFTGLLGDDAERFFVLRPSMQDLEGFAESLSPLYGIGEQGESSASSSS